MFDLLLLRSPLDKAYDDATDDDDTSYISAIPIDIILDSIKRHFESPLEYKKKDYIIEYIKKYEYTRDYQNIAEEETEPYQIMHDRFITEVLKLFEEYLDIAFIDIGDESNLEQCERIHHVYRFFIKNIKKNFLRICKYEITHNTSEFSSGLEKRRDVTYRTFKKEIDDEEYALILSNMNIVVERILDKIKNNYTVDKFLKVVDPGEYDQDYEFVKGGYGSQNYLIGNFIEPYCSMIDEEFEIELESKLRSVILKKFPNRENVNEELDNSNE